VATVVVFWAGVFWEARVVEYEKIADKLIELLKRSKPSKPKGRKKK
jgi:hypothetical protein